MGQSHHRYHLNRNNYGRKGGVGGREREVQGEMEDGGSDGCTRGGGMMTIQWILYATYSNWSIVRELAIGNICM